MLGTARTAPSALLAIANEMIDEAARLRCWPNDGVCDAARCGAAADKDETHRFGSLRDQAQRHEGRQELALPRFFQELNRLGFDF
jgi:hypothetical protein